MLLEVVIQTYQIPLKLEAFSINCPLEIHAMNFVGPLVAPVGDDRIGREFFRNSLFPNLCSFRGLPQVVDLDHARVAAHELELAIDTEKRTHLSADSCSSVSFPDLKVVRHAHRVFNIEKARIPSNLLIIGLAES